MAKMDDLHAQIGAAARHLGAKPPGCWTGKVWSKTGSRAVVSGTTWTTSAVAKAWRGLTTAVFSATGRYQDAARRIASEEQARVEAILAGPHPTSTADHSVPPPLD